ncbi:MAG: hypothetical protein JGK28_31825 [Microcoleus sp. PH2017_07_MST_O_A]|nr:hypothetical protein [Microcoleus sp. PH2017_07_MST_O_A]
MSKSLKYSINVLLTAKHSRCELAFAPTCTGEDGVIYYWTIDGAEPVDVDNGFATVEEAIASLIQYLETFVPPKEDDDDDDDEYDIASYEYYQALQSEDS